MKSFCENSQFLVDITEKLLIVFWAQKTAYQLLVTKEMYPILSFFLRSPAARYLSVHPISLMTPIATFVIARRAGSTRAD